MNRRTFLAGATGSAALGLAPAAAENTQAAHPVTLGEPYELAGKRMVFLNWHYVRTGSFAWLEPSGKKVSVNDALAPGVARFKHIDQPFGIRIRAVGAQRMGPLLPAENPWEEGSVTITTVIQDQGMYRGWAGPFTTSGDPPGQKHYMYFESHDGVT